MHTSPLENYQVISPLLYPQDKTAWLLQNITDYYKLIPPRNKKYPPKILNFPHYLSVSKFKNFPYVLFKLVWFLYKFLQT